MELSESTSLSELPRDHFKFLADKNGMNGQPQEGAVLQEGEGPRKCVCGVLALWYAGA
jgi:hypothetical protein